MKDDTLKKKELKKMENIQAPWIGKPEDEWERENCDE